MMYTSLTSTVNLIASTGSFSPFVMFLDGNMDFALMKWYLSYCKRMKFNKGIIKIARKLLRRIRFVLNNNKKVCFGCSPGGEGYEWGEKNLSVSLCMVHFANRDHEHYSNYYYSRIIGQNWPAGTSFVTPSLKLRLSRKATEGKTVRWI